MIYGIGLFLMGVIVIVMGMLDRRWGNPSWRIRILTGLAVALGGLYFLLRG